MMKLTNAATNTRPVHFGPLFLAPGESGTISDEDFVHHAGGTTEKILKSRERLKIAGVACESVDEPAPAEPAAKKSKKGEQPAEPPPAPAA